MSDLKFPIIICSEAPPLLGRSKIMQRLWNNLTKKTPSHLSVVGPRFVGKSVLLKALVQQMCGEGSPYCAIVRWDLGHQTPRSDGEFMKLLCQRLGAGIESANDDYGKHLLSVETDEYAEISEVMDALHDDDQKILMLWDGFDKPLSGGTLTRNLWDNLLELCRKPSFRLVTSTRKELHSLIRDEKSVTSDFWGIFEGVIRVGVFDDADIDDVLNELPDFEFQTGAKTEIINWSAGFPPFLLMVLNQIVTQYRSGKVDNEMVNQAAATSCEKLSAMLTSLWEDCPARAQDLYTVLSERRELPIHETGREERMALVEKGFAEESGNNLRPACRLLQEHIKGSGPDAGSMARMFGTWEAYRSNIRSLLERRLAHISRSDDRLYRYVDLSISLLPRDPELSLNNLTSIEERSLDLIWHREFGSDRAIPIEIISYWTTSPRDRNKFIKGMMNENSWVIPSERGLQLGLLQLLTGSMFGFESKSKVVSKDTYVLINAIHCYRNRTEHADGQGIHLGIAVAAIMTCLELLACLDREMES